MIVKMKFLQISGPQTDLDRMCRTYLTKHEMQLESALSELKTTDNLQPFIEVNPYRDPLAKAEQFCELLDKNLQVTPDTSMEEEEMRTLLRNINHDYVEMDEKKEFLKKKAGEQKETANALEPFRALDVDLGHISNYRFLKVRFGRIGLDYYDRMQKYLMQDVNAVFLEGLRNDSYVYGGYIVANKDKGMVDALFSSLHFERIHLTDAYDGTPEQIWNKVNAEMEATMKEADELESKQSSLMSSNAAKLLGAKLKLSELADYFDIRKKAAITEHDENQDGHYVICGWMSEADVESFMEEIKNDDKVMAVIEEDKEKFFGEPPTKLKNPKIFKPFEMFIEMYGLPASDEMDPTIFVALTYTIIFGAMFGDLGQGAVLFIGGGLLYLFKKMNLAGIVSVAGIFSMIFGVLYGSVFGFEDVIPALWLKPMDAMTTLPFVGQLNTVFIIAVAVGMGLNLLVMVFQMINAAKSGDKEDLLFSHNGLAGFVFYAFIVITIVLYMTGHKTPGNVLMIIFLGVPILMFFFKEPLGNIIEKRHQKLEGGKGMFFVQGFFELFETMLSYFSNTISYVRIGAFAVSHAAIMEVVLMLSGAEEGTPNILGVIVGNLIVMLLEGLVVGIQVLRLEYYEMFSRFYKGSGREFKPFNKVNNK